MNSSFRIAQEYHPDLNPIGGDVDFTKAMAESGPPLRFVMGDIEFTK